MIAEMSPVPAPLLSLPLLAQAYGTSAYNSNNYNGTQSTSTSAPPLPPNTGIHLPSSPADIALLFALAIAVGSISFALSRLLKHRRGAK